MSWKGNLLSCGNNAKTVKGVNGSQRTMTVSCGNLSRILHPL
jgi:hypothetical protein